ncbi:hypothetical protein SCLCIDRAFT_91723, partial [Scleroderma citrinum Foug A]
FECTHFTWYNRYPTQGDSTPKDVHPHLLYVKGAEHTNFSQLLPYQASEQAEHEPLYQNLVTAFDKVFDWVENMMSSYLPEEYEMLMQLLDHLPGNSHSPVPPFASLVINLNVCYAQRTEAHHDKQDKDLCLVLPIGLFEGGGLVLYEQGLVLELRLGDIIVFRSAETTHFNLDY